MKPADIQKAVADHDVRFIRLQFTDIFGIPKNVAITPNQLSKALQDDCMFDGSSIEGFARIEESDMVLQPDLSTFSILPWNYHGGAEARVICNVLNPDHTPFSGDPRHILKKVIEEAKKAGYDQYNVGPECEFFLFLTDEKGLPTVKTHDDASYFDLGPVDLGEDARREMVIALQDMGFEVEASHHEVAPGQHEIDFKYSDALKAADAIITFKVLVKTIAQRHGLYATFMPKPIYGVAGSGMHTNVSLYKNDVNVFYDANDPRGLSKDAYCFIGGLMRHIKGFTAVTNPLVNSYKRLVPGYEAPVHIAWSARNRSPLIRVPTAKQHDMRLELRSPDPSCNPYLSLALVLAAGLDGIKKDMIPPDPVSGNIYAMDERQLESRKIDTLPLTLDAAVKEMKKSELVRKTMGDHIFEKYTAAKQHEWMEYSKRVSEWELNEYLRKY